MIYFSKRIVRKKFQIFFGVIIAGFLLSMLYKKIVINVSDAKSSFAIQKWNRTKFNEEFAEVYSANISLLIKSPGCEIADYDIFDASVKRFIHKPKEIVCKTKFPEVTLASNSILYFYPSKFPSKFYSQFVGDPNFPTFQRNLKINATKIYKKNNVKCCYQSIERVTQTWSTKTAKPDTQWTVRKYCYPIINEKTTIRFDINKVTCKVKSKVIYTNLHSFIQKHKVEDKLKKWRVQSDSGPKKNNGEKLSVILVGTDSVSRLNFYRQNPNTLKFLKNDLDALEFIGYNKLAENTFPNTVPILIGITAEELQEHECLINQKKPKVFDNCSFIWNEFAENEFIVGIADDTPRIGTFNYPPSQHSGFLNPQGDYYGKPFFLALDNEFRVNKGYWEPCMGNQFSIQALYNYGLEFTQTFLNESTFSFLWTSTLTHDYLNHAKLADKFHLNYLTRLKKTGTLNNTLLIFMSDHGIRFGDNRKTLIGAMEERLPYFFLVLPEWFKHRYPKAFDNLNENSKTLMSNFDIHETLKDFANGRYEPTTPKTKDSPGISLLQKIPKTRGCSEAGIPENYCACLPYNKMTTDDDTLKYISEFIKNYLNELLSQFPLCSSFQKIIISKSYSFMRNKGDQTDKKKPKFFFFQATAFPGKALIEGTIEGNEHKKTFEVIGGLSRIDKYGNQSHCIEHLTKRKFCICKDILPYLTST